MRRIGQPGGAENSWGHRQHVSLIIAHESALTSVIGGHWWPLNSPQEFLWKPIPSTRSCPLFFFKFLYRQHYKGNPFFVFWQPRILTPFSASLTSKTAGLFFISPTGKVWGSFFPKSRKKTRRGVFQHFINPCQCCLICYPFRVLRRPPPSLCGQTKPGSPWRPLGTGDGSSLRLQYVWRFATGTRAWPFNEMEENVCNRLKVICAWLVIWPSCYSSNIYLLNKAIPFYDWYLTRTWITLISFPSPPATRPGVCKAFSALTSYLRQSNWSVCVCVCDMYWQTTALSHY